MIEKLNTETEGASVGDRLRSQLEASIAGEGCKHPGETVDYTAHDDAYRCRLCGAAVETIAIIGGKRVFEAIVRQQASEAEAIDRAVDEYTAEIGVPAPPKGPPPPNPDSLAHVRAQPITAAPPYAVADPAKTAPTPGLRVSTNNFDRAMLSDLEELRRIDIEQTFLDAKKAVIRDRVRQALNDTDEGKYTARMFDGFLAEATIAAGASKAVVVDRASVPEKFIKTEVDTTKAGKVLREGVSVPGLRLDTAAPVLRIAFTEPKKDDAS